MKFLCFFRMTLICIALLLSGSPLFAAIVEHHGNAVESETDHSECLSCHDGTVGKQIQYCMQDCASHAVHSVGRTYPPRGMQHEYATPGWLQNRGIRLFDNKVSCISCHDLAKQGKYHLAVETGLCQTCHVRK